MEWREWKVERVGILSKRGSPLRLANPFIGRSGKISVSGASLEAGALRKDFIEIRTKPGQRVVLSVSPRD
jgi:hypothetical protein